MKPQIKTLLIAIAILCGQWLITNGQSPEAIPYQAVARNSSGNLIQNQTISLRFSIHDGTAAGTIVYQETHSLSTNNLGLFSVNIGQGSANSAYGSFSSIDWANGPKFTQVEIDVTGGSTYIDMGTQQMLSVPFALYAKIAGATPGAVVYRGTWDAVANSPNLSSGIGTKGFYYVVTNPSSSASAPLDGINDWQINDWAIFNGSHWQKVDNSTAPVNASSVSFIPGGTISSTNVQDAIQEVESDLTSHVSNTSNPHNVTKAQVGLGNVDNTSDVNKPVSTAQAAADAAVQASVNTKVNKTGDTMSGLLVLSADPSTALGASTKQYVDAGDATITTSVNSKVNKTGDTMSGLLVLSADPSTALGAATKHYVDTGDATLTTLVNAKVNKAGDTMTGDLILHTDPTLALGAATKQYVDAEVSASGVPATRTVNGHALSSDVTVTKSDVGLGNVDNTSDVSKPVSTAQAAADAATLTSAQSFASVPSNIIQDATHRFATDAEKATWNAKLNLAGGTMTGSLVLDADPSVALGAATKQYVDAGDAAFNTSFISKTNDNVFIYQPAGSTHKRFGIGDTAPLAPLGIKGETGGDDQMIFFTSADATQKWNINLNPSSLSTPGFSIDDISTGTGVSRFFISAATGNMSLHKIDDRYLLGLKEYNPSLRTALSVYNTAVTVNTGWSMGHVNDNTVSERNGAFSFVEEPATAAGVPLERITILPSKNVGINEARPDATLHVTRPASDPQSEVNLSTGTGIIVAGPIDDKNLVLDSHEIQARTGTYAGGSTTLSLTVSALGIQPHGGDIIIHSDMAALPSQGIITDDAKLGLGTINPVEKIDIDGAIKIGNSLSSADGTIRYTGTDFEGRKGGVWESITNPSILINSSVAGSVYYNPATGNPKVGIGITTPAATLHVENNSIVTGSSAASIITNNSSTSSTSQSDNRIGLQINNTGSWGGNAQSKNIGLLVSSVSGQSAANANIAAVLNGNVVVGGVTSSDMIGSSGTNVLAIQSGTAPAFALGGSGTTTNTGIQIYSDFDATGTNSMFNVMNSNGEIIKLFRSAAITTPDNTSVGSTYGSNEATIIENMRSRINQLEQILIAHGLLSN